MADFDPAVASAIYKQSSTVCETARNACRRAHEVIERSRDRCVRSMANATGAKARTSETPATKR